MARYIDKDALVAEIERLVNNYDKALDYEAALEDVRNFIDSLQEEPIDINAMVEAYMGKQHQEPVSEELEKELSAYVNSKEYTNSIGTSGLLLIARHFANWQKEKEYTCYEEAFEDGAKWKVENLWKPADGDDLPEIDMEVIALVQDYPDDKDHLRVAFAHRPNKYAKVWNSDLGEEQVVEIEGYDKGGWNIPNVKWWLDCSLPKEIEL